jgi:hypothetical protein
MIVEIPGHIHQKMIESIRRAGLKETEYNRLLSIGRIYHTLSLVTEDNQSQDTVVIYVQQHKPQLVRKKNILFLYRILYF